MNNPNIFSDFRFDRLRLPLKVLTILGVVVILILAWLLLNPDIYFIFSLVVTAILVWVASYGWRSALISLIYFIERIIKL